MKKHILVLLTVLALIPFARLMAQAPPVAQSPAKSSAAPAPDVEGFLATLSRGQTETPSDLVPDPLFNSTICTSNSECPTGQLCCNICGAQPFDDTGCMRCVQPVRKRCPLVV